MQPTIPAEIMSDLRKWSEDEIRVKRRITEPAIIQNTPAKDSPQPSITGVNTKRAIALEKEKLNVRFKGIKQQAEPNFDKRKEQVARKKNYFGNESERTKNV